MKKALGRGPSQVLEAHLRLRNVSSVLRDVRVLPPASQYFHVTLAGLVGAHSGHGGGLPAAGLAPGMAIDLVVRFTPDSVADYEDCVVINTNSDSTSGFANDASSLVTRYEVPLRAARPRPVLTLPRLLSAGTALVGKRTVACVRFTNDGGHGRFVVVPSAQWPHAVAPGAVAQEVRNWLRW